MWKKALMLLPLIVCNLSAATIDDIFKELEKRSESFSTLQYRSIYFDREGSRVPGSDSATKMIRKDGKVQIHYAVKTSMQEQVYEVEALITPEKTYTRTKVDDITEFREEPTRSQIYTGMICHAMVLNDNATFKYTVKPEEKDGDLEMWVVEGEAKVQPKNLTTPVRVIWKFDKTSGLTVRTEAYNMNNDMILRGRIFDVKIDQEVNELLFNVDRYREKK